jgi:hypothetical protein
MDKSRIILLPKSGMWTIEHVLRYLGYFYASPNFCVLNDLIYFLLNFWRLTVGLSLSHKFNWSVEI